MAFSAGAVLSGPGVGLGLEDLQVAVHGHDAYQVSTGRTQDVALEPLRYLGGTESKQACGLGFDVVGLDVEVETRCIIDRLDRSDQPWQSFVQHGELRFGGDWLSWGTEGGGPEGRCAGSLGFGSVDQDGVNAASMHAPHGIGPRSLVAQVDQVVSPLR